MSAMLQPRKSDLRALLADAADTIIATRRKAEGWKHCAEEAIAGRAQAKQRAGRWALLFAASVALNAALILL
jgi:hypothetical protein